ncbi:MAG: response regulator [Oscillospiraceae bacterium]|nr:response regulator [Oscillospiraceae bacterium]
MANETGRPVILAVDDSPSILNAVASVLGGEYKVFKVADPTEVGKVLARVRPDLILLDYRMPGINGFELVPVIRGVDGGAEAPIIFLTSEGSLDNVTAAMALGACDFIVKPFKPEVLVEKVRRHAKAR